MKKIVSLALVALLCVGMLTACTLGGGTATVKHGFGTSISTAKSAAPTLDTDKTTFKAGKVQVDTAMVSVVVDKDGKILSIFFDTAQQVVELTKAIVPSVNDKGAIVAGKFQPSSFATLVQQTKVEKEDAYGMRDASPIKKEYFEQIKALQDWCKGKTIDQVLKMALNDKGAPTDAGLTSGCTITLTAYIAALEKAKANLK